MLIEPVRVMDESPRGLFVIESWTFKGPGVGNYVKLPYFHDASVQVIGTGKVIVEGGIDHKNYSLIETFDAPGLRPLTTLARYISVSCLEGSATVRLLTATRI